MKSVRYDQLPLKIDGIDVLALNFSASQSASLEPVYTLGRAGIHSQAPSSSRTYQASFSYVPVFQILDGSKGHGDNLTHFLKEIKENLNTNFNPFTLDIAGIQSNKSVLRSIQFSISPYSLIQFSVAFDIFGEFLGEVAAEYIDEEKSSLLEKSPNSIQAENINPHYTRLIASPGLDGSILRTISYSFNVNYQPVFKVGQEFPLQILYQNATEEVEVVETDREQDITFRGKDSSFDIDIHTLDPDYYLNIKMLNPVIVSESTNISAGEILSSSKRLRSFY